jgi:acyl-CoA thioesterase
MTFSEILASLAQANGAWTATVPDSWKQGRSIFGGLQSALALRAMRALVPPDVPLRVLQTTFIAPVAAGPVRIEARLLRAGKNAVHVESRIVDGDQAAAIIIGIFGAGRASQVDVQPRQPPVPPQTPIRFPFIPGVTPAFTRHFAMRWLRGSLPFTGGTLPHAVIEVGIEDAAPAGEEHVVAIADSIPPVTLSLLKSPVPGSSMAWTLEMFRDRFADLPLAGWRLDADLVASREGYTSQSVMVWGPGGEPVALSRQCMVVFG